MQKFPTAAQHKLLDAPCQTGNSCTAAVNCYTVNKSSLTYAVRQFLPTLLDNSRCQQPLHFTGNSCGVHKGGLC